MAYASRRASRSSLDVAVTARVESGVRFPPPTQPRLVGPRLVWQTQAPTTDNPPRPIDNPSPTNDSTVDSDDELPNLIESDGENVY